MALSESFEGIATNMHSPRITSTQVVSYKNPANPNGPTRKLHPKTPESLELSSSASFTSISA